MGKALKKVRPQPPRHLMAVGSVKRKTEREQKKKFDFF